MKQVYELRFGSEIIGIFPTESKAVKAMAIYMDYLKFNNGIEAIDLSSSLNKYSMIVMSDNKRLFILERDLFQTTKDFRRYLGVYQ